MISISIQQSHTLPAWRQPKILLLLMAIAMPISFFVWSALLNNFTIEVAGFDGADIGWLHTVREIPGFFAIGVLSLLIFIREQALGLLCLGLLGAATALTAQFPSLYGILTITMLSSIGFHYFETINQSLQLQWIEKKRAPQILGWLLSAGSFAAFIAYMLIIVAWKPLSLSYNIVYLIAGGLTITLVAFAFIAFPRFIGTHPQNTHIVLRKRYWLYYLLQFMSGARRQIFIVFAGFMMVKHFNFSVDQITALFMVNLIITMFAAPLVGKLIGKFGEKQMLLIEYAGLSLVFSAYAGIYIFGWGATLAATLFVINNIFFSMALALKTYFQKIADPKDIAPTAAVAFTINHIAAVFLPAALGYLWVFSPSGVYIIAAIMALISFAISTLVPRHPMLGNETILAQKIDNVNLHKGT